MKKLWHTPIAVSVLILFIITIGLGCTGKNMSIMFETTTHTRNDTYSRTFQMEYADLEILGIGVESGLLTDEELRAVGAEIYAAANKIRSFNGLTDPASITVYVLGSTIAGGAYRIGNECFCTLDDIESGEFRIPMWAATYDMREQWTAYGLDAAAFGEREDAEALKAYLNTEDLNLLSLFAVRFLDEWNTPEQIEYAKQAATSLAEYVIKNSGAATLLKGVDIDMKNAWLSSLGVNRVYTYEFDKVAPMFSVAYEDNYPLIVCAPNVKYYLTPVEDALTTSDQVEAFLYENQTGAATIRDYLCENAPAYVEHMNFKDVITYYTYDYNDNLTTITNGNVIYIYGSQGTQSHLHEYVHAVMQGSARWLQEAFAEYFDVMLRETYYSNNLYNVHTQSDSPDDIAAFQYYAEHGGTYGAPSEIDCRLYIDGYTYASLIAGLESTPAVSQPIYEAYRLSGLRTDGDELSYMQAYSFLNYLIDRYDFECVVQCYVNQGDCKLMFGESYSTLKASWLDGLSS